MDTNRHMQMLGPVDTAFWHLDTEITPMNIGSVMLFDGRIDFDKLVTYVDTHLHLAPLYKQRVINAPFNMTEPTWVFDDDFHIDYHIRRVALPEPGTDEQLREVAGRLISGRLNPEKPLWELYMVEGLQGERTALVIKVHHCMVDGISAIELFTLLLDFTEDETTIQEKPLYNPPPTPSDFDLLQASLRRSIPHRMNILKHVGGDALKVMVGLLERDQRKKILTGMVSIINDHLTPIRKLPINGANTGELTFAWAEFPLDDIKAIRRARRASVNDVMLTILGTAIGRYVEEKGNTTNQDFVRIICPVDMRRGEDVSHDGNRISTISVEVPFYTGDVLERLDAVAQYSRVMKDSQLATMLDGVLSMPSLAHPSVQPVIWGLAPGVFAALAHMWCTNVPGPQIPMYLMGHRMTHVAGFFPLNPSMGLASVVLSYDGKIAISLVADSGIVPDVPLLQTYLEDAYIELCDAVGFAPKLRDPVVEDEEEEVETPPIIPDEAPPPVTQNGSSTAVSAQPKTETRPRLMTDAWAKALQEVINTSKSYYDASTRWTAGALAFVMKASPENGYPQDSAVLLDLYRGKCRMGRGLPVAQAYEEAAFVLEGSYHSWMNVLEGRSQPIPMIVRGQLKLKKGALPRLLPFTRSAQELVKCAMQVS